MRSMSTKHSGGVNKETKVIERRRNWRLQRGQTQQTGASRPSRDVSAVSPNSGRRDSWWRTTISQFSRQKSLQYPCDVSTTPGIVMRPNPSRRQSFLYRTGTQLDASSTWNLKPDGPGHWDRDERQFITPFAQILSILKKAHGLLRRYKNDYTEVSSSNTPLGGSLERDSSPSTEPSLLSSQTLEETIRDFDWCLEVLESLQCKRSVSSLTRAKFCSILSRELSTSLSDSTTGLKGADQEEQSVDDIVEDVAGEEGAAADDALAVAGGTTSHNESVDGTESVTSTGVKPTGRHRPYLSRIRSCAGGLRHSNCSSQISDYIYQTFVEEDDDEELAMQRLDDEVDRLEKKNNDCSGIRLNGSAFDPLDVAELKKQEPLRRSSGPKDEIPVKPSANHCLRELSTMWKEPSLFNVNAIVRFIEENDNSDSPDFFYFHQLTNNHCLSTFGLYLLQKRGVLSKLAIPPLQMWCCLQRVESLYNSKTPYHNSIHAMDVLHTMHTLFTFNQLDTMFSDLEIFATLFACIIHDIDHPGVTNQYLVNTNSDLALLYNDSSVLENHHLFVAFNLLHSEPECNFSARFTQPQRQLFRKMVISLVLSTDMSKHMSLLADLKTMVESQRASGSNVINLDTYSSRIQILESLIHAADLGNPTKPLPIYQQWVSRITEEMFRQGDREREAGLDISPMCDRHKACVSTTQVSFIDYIVYPLWETLSELLHPNAKPLLENMTNNRDWYARNSRDK